MFNWKYYFPFLFLVVGMSSFIHFHWLPNYLVYEKNETIKQEKQFLIVLGKTLLPSLISGDLAEVKITLDEVLKSRDGYNSIKLYSQEGNLIYPFFTKEIQQATQNIKIVFVVVVLFSPGFLSEAPE